MSQVLFLSPPFVKGFTRNARWAAKSRGRVQRHPDYLLIAAAVVERAGHTVKYIEGTALDIPEADVLEQARQFSPDVLVILATTPSIYNDIAWAGRIKDMTGCLTVLVGQHVSAAVDNTFDIAGGAVDVVVRGEYDGQLKEIADRRPLADVRGISFLENNGVRHNDDALPIDVNDLPFPAWHHIRPEWYPAFGKRSPYLTLLSGRGCNNRCTFCRDPQIMYGRKLRNRDPKLVVDEMEYDYHLFPDLAEIMIETDTFTASPKHVQGVCEEILRRNLKISLSTNARVDCKPELLPLMRKAGFRWLNVGFEFGTDEQLKAVKKGTTIAESIRFAQAAKKAGLKVHGCFMIGAPGETRQSAEKTIDFAKSIPMDTVQFTGITVYPGTEMYEQAKKEGYLITSDWTEWLNPAKEQVTNLRYDNLTTAEINKLVDRGLKAFYLRPSQIWRIARGMRTWGDVKSKFYGFLKFLDYTTGDKAKTS